MISIAHKFTSGGTMRVRVRTSVEADLAMERIRAAGLNAYSEDLKSGGGRLVWIAADRDADPAAAVLVTAATKDPVAAIEKMVVTLQARLTS